MYEEESNIKGLACVLCKRADAAYHDSDFDDAVAFATTALNHYKTLNDNLGIADASLLLGDSLLVQDKLDEALVILREGLEIYRSDGNDVGTALCLERIGTIHSLKAPNTNALPTLDEAVAVATRSGDRMATARAVKTLGCTYCTLGDFVKAADALLETITITRNIGWEFGLADCLCLMGYAKLMSGEYREADEFLRESILISRKRSLRLILARSLRVIGSVFLNESKPNEAATALEESCLLYQELSRHASSTAVASMLVELKISEGDWNRVLFWHDHIISSCRRRNEHMKVADHLEQKGKILASLQRHDEAALNFEAAMVIHRENGYSGSWQLRAIPKTAMKWERRLPLLCDLKRLQRRQPLLVTASLKFPIPIGHGEA